MVEFLKIQFQMGKVTREQIEKLVSNGKLTIEQSLYIME